MSATTDRQINLDFTADGVIVVEMDGRALDFTLCGDGDVATLAFTAGEGNVAATLSAQTGTFGGGTITIEKATLGYQEIGTTEALWKANTNGAYWETVTLSGTSSWTASFGSYIDNPFRFVRFRLAGATNPRIKGKGILYPRVK